MPFRGICAVNRAVFVAYWAEVKKSYSFVLDRYKSGGAMNYLKKSVTYTNSTH